MRQWEIQQAIYEELTTYVPLVNSVTGIYDHVPQKTDYPYVNIGEDTGVQWDTGTSHGVESTLTIHVWSRKRGRKQCKEIMQIIYNILHEGTLDIVGMKSVLCYWDFSETMLDPDGLTRHGVMRFRILAEEATS